MLEEHRAKDPTAKVAYHDIIENESGSGFKFTRKHMVHFCPDKNQQDQNQLSLASTVPKATFENSECVKILWVVKWQAIGLMPVRPIVVLVQGCDVPPQHALKLV